MTSLIAEDLLLLLLDDESGDPLVDGTRLPRVLAGAVLLELALDGYVTPADQGEDVERGRFAVRRAEAPADPILARALGVVADARRPMKPEAAIEKLDSEVRAAVFERVIDRGWVRESRRKVLGIFPSKVWPPVDESHERGVRHELSGVLVEGLDPTPRAAALISLLSAVDAAAKVFPDTDRKMIRKRAKEIADGEWAGAAVRKAVDAINSAVFVAVMVPAMAAGSS
ncbi:GPP34 family phosphoprotein [Rhodococcus hoagii]|uniref:GOLPH3/VPS74 family protein n=1 Tax=Prescottella TaxID=2979332 RepID=UPI001A01A7D2|nr:GPP34 family phosphoprotein [Prescottella equi]MDP8016342.1 GPP34 family phosphoprotein [Prescottella equi]NKR42763.1 GPP34 family phosphoprotein [Prescottella equi]NKR50927.1 GPP34 family phosphoprotein [Prescottella equi]NKR77880.1 GPP34 family phosphoprotein [Prescottella equi]NKT02821.1 GPP34 family phosphoprotein [Prescottella equi]